MPIVALPPKHAFVTTSYGAAHMVVVAVVVTVMVVIEMTKWKEYGSTPV